MFSNIALPQNKRNYNTLRKYLLYFYDRGWITSYTLRPTSLKIRWFNYYVPRVISYFTAYEYKYCPTYEVLPDSKDIGVPLGIKGEDGRYITNDEPFHWLPNWRDEQKERERTAHVRSDKEGTDIYRDCRDAKDMWEHLPPLPTKKRVAKF
jgi:hypothetical protein